MKRKIQKLFNKNEIFRRINRQEFACFFNLITKWEKIVGKSIASKAFPRFINRNKLYLTVTSSAWRMELNFLKNEIIKKINEFSEYKITDIDYRIGNISNKNIHATPSERSKISKEIFIDEERINEVIKDLPEEELKIILKDLMTKHYQRGEVKTK